MTTNRVYKARRDRWLADLRSADYQQIRGSLHVVVDGTMHGFCCLGVLCATQGTEAGVGPPIAVQKPENVRYCYNGSVTALPKKLHAYLGFKAVAHTTAIEVSMAAVKKFFGEDHYVFSQIMAHFAGVSLETLNDNGLSFLEIADFIEAHPSELWQEGTY